MTHAQLVDKAMAWLKNYMHCGVVLREHYVMGFEAPDALGWRHGGAESVQVECKVSRADFLRDRKKACRRRFAHLGAAGRPADRCYYLVPDALKLFELLPDGWGLLSADGRRVRVITHPDSHCVLPMRAQEVVEAEKQRLVYELRRYQAQGIVYRKAAEMMERRRISVGQIIQIGKI